MARDPATKAQVQAHRFLLRRVESALVRQDPVMLHEPARTHVRSVIVGLAIAALGAAAFFVVGIFAGDDDLADSDIVVGKDSGAMYVVEHRKDAPLRLIPVPNLASARLLAAGLAGEGQRAADVDLVEDSALEDAPRGPMTGIEGAPGYLPGKDRQIGAKWALCEDSGTAGTTTVLAGSGHPGRALGPAEALVVRDPADRTWLIWNGRRSEIDLSDPAVTTAYELSRVEPRRVSATFLNAVPQAPPIAAPMVPHRGVASRFPGLADLVVGDVAQVDRGQEEYYLIYEDGKQQLEGLPLLRLMPTSPVTVPPGAINPVPESPTAQSLDHFPVTTPAYLDPVDAPVACLGWEEHNGEAVRTLSVSDTVPVPDGKTPVELPGADGPGGNLDLAYVPPAEGAFVRSVTTGQGLGSGQLFLVTDQGIRYAIPHLDVARVLGLGADPRPAPNEIVRLLPEGAALDPEGAVRLYRGTTGS